MGGAHGRCVCPALAKIKSRAHLGRVATKSCDSIRRDCKNDRRRLGSRRDQKMTEPKAGRPETGEILQVQRRLVVVAD